MQQLLGSDKVIAEPAVGDGEYPSAEAVEHLVLWGLVVPDGVLVAFRVSYSEDAVFLGDGLVKTMGQLAVGRGGVYSDIGDSRQKRHIENALMGLAVLADDACAVNADHSVCVADSEIVEDLVIGSL